MQTLYELERFGTNTDVQAGKKILQNKIEESNKLFNYLVYFTLKVAGYAEVHARNKASKHLPTEADLSVNTRLAGNELLWKIKDIPQYDKAVHEGHFNSLADNEIVKKVFLQLAGSEEYKEYIEQPERHKKTEKGILEFIFNDLMLPNEDFIQHVETLFINWDDDAEMMQILVQNYFGKPDPKAHSELLGTEKTTFAYELLQTVIDKRAVLLELIKPKLNNWDHDRIAGLDLILLEMGTSEFLFFETIPTKVTINEYIDLAKAYSTPQSGHFINGLLDNLNKELSAQNKIQKKKYKNSVI